MSQRVVTVLSLSYWYPLEGREMCCEDGGLRVFRQREAEPPCEVSERKGTMDSFATLFKYSGLCFIFSIHPLAGSGSPQLAWQ